MLRVLSTIDDCFLNHVRVAHSWFKNKEAHLYILVTYLYITACVNKRLNHNKAPDGQLENKVPVFNTFLKHWRKHFDLYLQNDQ